MAAVRADICAQSDFRRREKEEELAALRRIYEEIQEKKQCVSLKELAVDGSDLIALGMKPGKEIGDMLAWLLDAVLEEPELNTREKLTEMAVKSGKF